MVVCSVPQERYQGSKQLGFASEEELDGAALSSRGSMRHTDGEAGWRLIVDCSKYRAPST